MRRHPLHSTSVIDDKGGFMQEVKKVTYRGYDITIAVDDEPHSPEDWYADEVVFVSFDATWSFPEAEEKHPLFRSSHGGRAQGSKARWNSPEDLLQFMAADSKDTTSAYRVFAVEMSWEDSMSCARRSSFCGEVFVEEYPPVLDEDGEPDHDAWIATLPSAAIVVRRDTFLQPDTPEVLANIMITGEVPDWDEEGAEHHYASWLAWFTGEVYLYIVSTDDEQLKELGVSDEDLPRLQLEDSCCGFYDVSAASRRPNTKRLLPYRDVDYGGALDEAKAVIDSFLCKVVTDKGITLPKEMQV